MRRRSDVVASSMPTPIATRGPNGETVITSPAIPGPPEPPRAPDLKLASKELAEEMKKPPPLFASANRGDGLTPDFDALVETVFSVDDLHKEYSLLVEALYVGEQRGDYGTLLKAADQAEDHARRAHRLFLNARMEQERWLVEADKVTAEMRRHAVSALEEEKAAGDKKKMITEGDVDAKIAQLYPDEWKHQRLKKFRVKATVEQMERLSDLWKGRCSNIATMLKTQRK